LKLEIEYLNKGFCIHQEAYIIKVCKNVLNGQVTSIMHSNSCEVVKCSS